MLPRAASLLLGSRAFELAVAGSLTVGGPPLIVTSDSRLLRLDAVMARNTCLPAAAFDRATEALTQLLSSAADTAPGREPQVVATGRVWEQDPAALHALATSHNLEVVSAGTLRQARWLAAGVAAGTRPLARDCARELLIDIGHSQVRVVFVSGGEVAAVGQIPVGVEQLSVGAASWQVRLDRVRKLVALKLASLHRAHPDVRGACLSATGQTVGVVRYIREQLRPWPAGELLPRQVDLGDVRAVQAQLLAGSPAQRAAVADAWGAVAPTAGLLLAVCDALRPTADAVAVSPWGLVEGAALCALTDLPGGD